MNPRRRFLLDTSRAALGLSLFPIAACSKPKPDPAVSTGGAALRALIADLEKQIPAWLEQANTPALSMALVDGGKLVWRGAFGVRDLVSRAPVDQETVFEAGSVSKTVFASAAMKLQSVMTGLTGRLEPSDCKTFEAGMKMCATDFDAYMKTKLLGPVGMVSSGYVWN